MKRFILMAIMANRTPVFNSEKEVLQSSCPGISGSGRGFTDGTRSRTLKCITTDVTDAFQAFH